MRINKLPTGYLEFENDLLTIGGGETITVLAKDIISVEFRDGKKTIFSKNPPAILEIRYKAGIDNVVSKVLIDKNDKLSVEEFCDIIKSRLNKGG